MVISGNSPESVNSFGQIWPAFDACPRKMDAGIFDLDAPTGQITWRMKALFGSHWEWLAPANPGQAKHPDKMSFNDGVVNNAKP